MTASSMSVQNIWQNFFLSFVMRCRVLLGVDCFRVFWCERSKPSVASLPTRRCFIKLELLQLLPRYQARCEKSINPPCALSFICLRKARSSVCVLFLSCFISVEKKNTPTSTLFCNILHYILKRKTYTNVKLYLEMTVSSYGTAVDLTACTGVCREKRITSSKPSSFGV